ncbi:LLM class flavin-dependent oxidoreductase [Microlunatus speluncae]|uniref:LLM class flavin-dependent oxidoreductase n=1 Tax=Microlunatus speluncae TaxID=2594267 RepID=UPI001266289D|nr:LLM class flavin-dependent oxidoreductase [Microlunatus speluncae]
MTDLALSVLDLVPVRTDQTTAAAIQASLRLAETADELGFTRYWVAEHHNMPAVAATNPPVLIGVIAAATRRIRVGSGGVMLPNHAPLVVAEQFALLEAAYPGRIDLGIGRAPGSDPVTNYVLRSGGGRDDKDIERFPDYVSDVIALMDATGVELELQGRRYPLRATPKAEGSAKVWLLGSSLYSAELAAAQGLPYVFAHHFSGEGTAEALRVYRSNFRPSDLLAEPKTFLTVNAAVAPTNEEAQRLIIPQQLAMIALRTGGELKPSPLIEDAERVELPPAHRDLAEAMSSRWVVGDPPTAAARIRDLAHTFGVDEVMINPIAGALTGTAADRFPAREQTLRLLAGELLGSEPTERA